jgi:hypothetical protein
MSCEDVKTEPERGVIGIRTAIILYAVLIAASFFALKGTALVIALLIVGALAAKSVVHYFRQKIE